jgi:hypothetical protein
LAIVVAGVVAFRGAGQSGVQRQIAAIRNAGLPASSAELDRWYERPAASNNAALLVVQASRDHVYIGGILSSFPAVGEAVSPEIKKAMVNISRRIGRCSRSCMRRRGWRKLVTRSI